MSEPIEKMSHADVAEMSPAELKARNRAVFRRLIQYMKPYKKRFAMGAFFGILAGMSNAIVIFTMRAVFKIILDPEAERKIMPFHNISTLPGEVRNISFTPPEFIAQSEWAFTLFACSLIPIMVLGRGLLGFLHIYCFLWIEQRMMLSMRTEAYSGLLRQSLEWYNKEKQGGLIQTAFNQTRMAANAGTQVTSALIKNPVAIAVTALALIVIDPLYAAGALIFLPLCILPIQFVLKKVRKAGSQEETAVEQIMVTLQESFSGIKVIKAHAREEYEIDRFVKGAKKQMFFILRWRKAMEIVGPLVESVATFGIAGGLIYAKIKGLDFSDFLVLNMALMSMYPPAKALSRSQILLAKCTVAASKVFALIDSKPAIEDPPDAIELKYPDGPLVFDKVTFGYGNDAPAVKGISLEFEPGKFYALVGQSGSGKSTLLSLIMRFYDPDKGTISLAGHDIKKYTQSSLRDQIGLVLQDTFLFHDTIYNNIHYGRLDATKEEVIEAAKMANAHDFIMEKPEGYKTICGDKGVLLSGGQQQRLSIARAILRNAPILLLDEATSALDTESEQKIQEALAKLEKGKTVIAIAHRLSTVLNADKIILMHNGRARKMGTHEELLEMSGRYRRLYDLQFQDSQQETVEAVTSE